MENKKISFEEALPIIDSLLSRNKGKWTLKAILHTDYEDVCQIIRLHIFNKWSQYNPKHQLEPWVNTIILNQMRNIRRNIYDSCSRPCLKCVYNQGGESCGWTKSNSQTDECPLFKKWCSGKKYAHNIKLPVSMENHINEVNEIPEYSLNIEKFLPIVAKHLEKKLKPAEYRVFEMLFIKGMSNDEVAIIMGFSGNETNRKPGYGRIAQIKRKIIQKAKEMKDDIDLF